MHQGFSIVSIEPIFVENKIIVNTSFDIDPESAINGTVNLLSVAESTDVNISFSIERKKIIIDINGEIIPNTEYILRVSNLKSILDEPLTSGVRKRIIFKSAIKEIPIIINPANYEEVENLRVFIKTLSDNNVLESNYYRIQIANDSAFIEVALETLINKEFIDLKDLESGQYFIRVRLEEISNDEIKDYGRWSEIVTFVVKNTEEDNPDCDGDNETNPDEPGFVEDIRVVNSPINGNTPESIIIEFSGIIDPDYIDNIVVIRRDI